MNPEYLDPNPNPNGEGTPTAIYLEERGKGEEGGMRFTSEKDEVEPSRNGGEASAVEERRGEASVVEEQRGEASAVKPSRGGKGRHRS